MSGNASSAAQFRPRFAEPAWQGWNFAAGVQVATGWRTAYPRRSGSRLCEDASVDVAHVRHAAQRHGDVELLAEDFDRLGDAGFPARAQPVDVGAADHAGARAP